MPKPKTRKVRIKAWALIDCQWGTIREIRWFKQKESSDCRECKIIPVTIEYEEKKT